MNLIIAVLKVHYSEAIEKYELSERNSKKEDEK
jgi:hypothetical protein